MDCLSPPNWASCRNVQNHHSIYPGSVHSWIMTIPNISGVVSPKNGPSTIIYRVYPHIVYIYICVCMYIYIYVCIYIYYIYMFNDKMIPLDFIRPYFMLQNHHFTLTPISWLFIPRNLKKSISIPWFS